MHTIMFIHGYGGSRKDYLPLMHYLEKNGTYTYLEYSYTQNKGEVPIRFHAKQVSHMLHKKEDVIIVGFSQGGIIGAVAAEMCGARCKKIITICSPFSGSLFASFIEKPGVIDLRLNSSLLLSLHSKMNNSQIKYYAIWNPLDLVVFPGWNAKNSLGVNTMIITPFHPLTFIMPSTKRLVKEYIDDLPTMK